MPELEQLALDALVAPGLILSSQPLDQRGDRVVFPNHACALAAPTPTRRISIALARDGYRPPSTRTIIEILQDAAARRTAVA